MYTNPAASTGGASIGDVVETANPNLTTHVKLGQAISRTTYAALFALVGTSFGAGDGSTTFDLPKDATKLLKAFTGTPLATARAFHSSVLLPDGRILVTGGTFAGVATNTTLFLTISGNTISFASGDNLPATRYMHSSVVTSDGKVLITGGYVAGAASNSTIFLTITGNTISYTTGSTLSATRLSHTTLKLNDNRILVVGGVVAGGISTSVLLLTITGAATFTSAVGTSLPDTARGSHACVPMSSGVIAIIGGSNASGALNSVLLINSISGNTISSMVAAGVMPIGITYCTAHEVEPNRIAVIGGNSGGFVDSSSIIFYLSVVDSCIDTGESSFLPTALLNHSSVKLVDGSILVTGGYTHYSVGSTLNTFLRLTGLSKYMKF